MKWLAIYSDETYLCQYNDDGTENLYTDIDRSKLAHFAMLQDDNKLALTVALERASQKLICRKRTFMDINGVVKGIVWLVGWHENVNGTSIKSICYIYLDGHIELAGSKDDYELMECEK
jgi:hypothetical protein